MSLGQVDGFAGPDAGRPRSGRSDNSFVVNRCPSEIRSTSTAIASTELSSFAMRSEISPRRAVRSALTTRFARYLIQVVTIPVKQPIAVTTPANTKMV